MPRNRWTVFAAIWFAAAWYGLLRENGGSEPPPFPHFDKVSHAALFFAQIWLCVRAFAEERRPVPYIPLLFVALLFAVASETAQMYLTRTRSGDWLDGCADLAGAAAALLLARSRYGTSA